MYIKYRQTGLKETGGKIRHIKITCSVIIVVTCEYSCLDHTRQIQLGVSRATPTASMNDTI